ncbi:MAG TPA: nuclear transport factor 2 family protein [Mycobacteriales bacterium]|nr:nuclear transport factor 2 family protein [Mycobacteriales bacterium]
MNADLTFADVFAGVMTTIARYNHAVDDGRTDDAVATYCADGSCDIPGLGAHQGHDALRAAYTLVEPKGPQCHLVSGTHITDWSADRASAVSDFAFLVKRDTAWTVMLTGRYTDELCRDGDVWRFHRRVGTFR